MYCRYKLIKVFLYGINFCLMTVCGFNLTDYELLLTTITNGGKFERDFNFNVQKVSLFKLTIIEQLT